MRALVFHGPWTMSVEERPDPEPASGEVVIQILATGICGSDLHGFTGENGRRHPGQVMGHETVGRVLAAETPALVGQLVTVNPVLGCGGCAACQAGSTQRCGRRRVIGVTPGISSAFAERMVVPVANVVPLPEMAAHLGTLVEPLAVGYHATVRAEVGPDDRVLVIGGGPIGQACALAARRRGATGIVVSEYGASRRSALERLGFGVVDPGSADIETAVREQLGEPASVVLDAVGASGSLADAFAASDLGARVVLIGMQSPQINLAAYDISTEERTLIGSFSYSPQEFRDTALWMAANLDPLAPLVDATVELDEAPEAFRRLASGEWSASKVLVMAGPAVHS